MNASSSDTGRTDSEVEELIPESHQHNHRDAATVGTLGGFLVMMILDVALG